MRVARLVPAAAVPVLAVLAGCGGGEPGSSTPRSDLKTLQDAQLGFARCMRENGVDLPDPEIDEKGRVTARGPRNTVDQRKYKEAESSCRKHLEAYRPPELSVEQQQELFDAALAHSKCMRENGFENFKDPVTDGKGRVAIELDPEAGMSPDSPRFRKANEICEIDLPALP